MKNLALAAAFFAASTSLSHAGEGHSHGAIKSEVDNTKVAAFDIVKAHVKREGRVITFKMETAGVAGDMAPEKAGSFAGAPIWAYVWPTSLDPKVVGFESGSGILALAATNHPDFDDTPLFDENVDGDTGNDGGHWHSHWVVLVPNDKCGPGALAVRDIQKGTNPKMPATWPGVPFFLDSPGYTPVFDGHEIKINVALAAAETDAIKGASFDGVTTALKVNATLHEPNVCVTDVFDIASGDLSLPGKVD